MIVLLSLLCTFALSVTVAVSIRPLELIVKEILPEGHNVVCVMNKDSNPHLYQLKTSDLELLNRADLIILAGFEQWASKVQSMFANKVLMFSEGVFEKDFEEDEHLWLDPVNVLVFSHLLMLSFSRLEPGLTEQFEANWVHFSKRLLERFWLWNEKLAPVKNRIIVEVHPALTHFAKRFDLGEIFALETGHEVGLTTKKLAELTNLVKKGLVKHLFVDEHVESAAALKLAEQLNLQPVTIDLMGWSVGDYIQLMDSLVEKLAVLRETK
ncbi:metal ABC transporter substrate-binding protein [Thermotoga sp. Ku-13t]|uniref:metal ABC transporter substrate-binding protein n=1 Tax=Thermotoga sp. Ku-13t TaxID=1755813 RepID=UPI001F4998AD|nr:metal ABC transporter substrate-binding protein [Thermotoga sp. Ku-13t]